MALHDIGLCGDLIERFQYVRGHKNRWQTI
jgi:hypothetical protein